jgi:uncharacterized membrane protein YkvA (DUF1232 family)
VSAIRDWARQIKQQTLALYFAVRDPRTPWYVKLFAGFIVAYAISPVDLIPDFIPVLGFLDEVILLPAAIWLAVRLVPPAVLNEARRRAAQAGERPTSRIAGTVIVLIWIGALVLCVWWAYKLVA